MNAISLQGMNFYLKKPSWFLCANWKPQFGLPEERSPHDELLNLRQSLQPNYPTPVLSHRNIARL